MSTQPTNGASTGKVVQIIGPVLDVEFESGYLPPIYTALRVTSEGTLEPTGPLAAAMASLARRFRSR